MEAGQLGELDVAIDEQEIRTGAMHAGDGAAVELAFAPARLADGIIDAKMPMTVMTMSSSISVKPRCQRGFTMPGRVIG